MPRNDTQNQHYVSQSEQRLNAANPAAQPENKKIHAFPVVNRDLPELGTPRLAKIEKNLSWQDLFTYHVPDVGPARENLEALFGEYENRTDPATRALLDKIAVNNFDIRTELTNLFCVKYMNLLRNPRSVGQISGMLDIANAYNFTDPVLAQHCESVLSGHKPQRDAVCARFGLTPEGYDAWLRALFFLLNPMGGGRTVLDSLVEQFFANSIAKINVHYFKNEHCLLSDRGFNWLNCDRAFDGLIADGAVTAGHGLGVEFNLTKNAFISFMFLFRPSFPAHAHDGLLGKIVLRYTVDDMLELASYNRCTVRQSFNEVYCAKDRPLLRASGDLAAFHGHTISTIL